MIAQPQQPESSFGHSELSERPQGGHIAPHNAAKFLLQGLIGQKDGEQCQEDCDPAGVSAVFDCSRPEDGPCSCSIPSWICCTRPSASTMIVVGQHRTP